MQRSPVKGPGLVEMFGLIEGGCCLQPHLQGVWIANAGRLQMKGGSGYRAAVVILVAAA